ncbi:MAG: hypothetical protein ABW252_25650 [Polyangiales bacterium]
MRDLLGNQPIARVRTTIDALMRRVRGGGRTVPPPRAELGTPLDAVNDTFHEAYEGGRTVARREHPVFVVLADSLVFFRSDQREEHAFSPRAFHVIKSVAHAPVALYALLEAAPSPHDEATRAQLARARTQVEASQRSLEREQGLEPSVLADCRDVLRATREELDRYLDGDARRDPAARDAFAARLGPRLHRMVHAATALQLAALHAHTEAALHQLDAHERAALEVVVTGDHQARARSLPMQYFCKRLGEPEHGEHRVTYAEGVSDEHGALALVGTRRLDRNVARAFFGDERRMQRDILGDAAHDLLAEADLTKI